MQMDTQHGSSSPEVYVDQYGVYHAYYEPGGTARISTLIVHLLADVAGSDVTDSGFALNDIVDPDALDTLYGPKGNGEPRAGGRTTFNVWNYEVTIYSHGEITLRRLDPPPQSYPPRQG